MRFHMLALAAPVLLSAAVCGAQQSSGSDGKVPMNAIQMIGTHNSYHAGFAPSEAKYWKEQYPRLFDALDYTHPSLTSQLDHGTRQLEIDVYADTKGGLYAHPDGLRRVAEAGLPRDPDFDPKHLMEKPGFKVMHVQDIDYRSSCQPFTACLAEVKAWSKAHPKHLPLYLLIETKQGKPVAPYQKVTPEEFTPEVFDALDKEIFSVFDKDEIITPDEVRGNHETLNEAVQQGGWPTLDEARGKVVFLMDQKVMGPVYLQGHPSLKGRVVFTNATPGDPDAAFTEQNESSAEVIEEIVRKGYLVRTRSDADTKEARANDTKRREASFASGAQIISTDYPAAEPASTGFSVSLPGGEVARCSPVLKPAGCVDAGLEPKK